MRVLVTGGAGYIGSMLVPTLLSKGYQVDVVDNFMFEQMSLNQCFYNKNLTVVNGDVRQQEVLLPLMKKADVVIPLAAFVGAPLCAKDPIGARAINHDAVIMMLNNLSREQMVIMPTTNSAYGTGDENHFCTEESPLRPISQYAIEKVEVEKALMDRGNAISLRLATVFGMSPRMRLDLLVNDFCYRAVTDGFIVLFESNFKRNYIHVRDVAKTFLHALENYTSMAGEVYNVGLSSANISKLELCNAIKKYVPSLVVVEELYKKDPDQRNYIVSNEKLEATGWQPDFTLDLGIEELTKGLQVFPPLPNRNA